MNTIELKNFAFTLQIPSFKKVRHFEHYKAFKDYPQLEQESILYEFVRIACSEICQTFDIKFEVHADGRKHAHGVFYQISSENLEDIKLSLAKLIGIKSEKQINDCCYCIPIFLSHGWNTYINKFQGSIVEDIEEKDYSIYQFGKKK